MNAMQFTKASEHKAVEKCETTDKFERLNPSELMTGEDQQGK